MSTYRTVIAAAGKLTFPAIVLVNDLTDDGYQMYCGAGWLRRSQEWLDVYSVPTADDTPVEGLLAELRGRGITLVKEVSNG